MYGESKLGQVTAPSGTKPWNRVLLITFMTQYVVLWLKSLNHNHTHTNTLSMEKVRQAHLLINGVLMTATCASYIFRASHEEYIPSPNTETMASIISKSYSRYDYCHHSSPTDVKCAQTQAFPHKICIYMWSNVNFRDFKNADKQGTIEIKIYIITLYSHDLYNYKQYNKIDYNRMQTILSFEINEKSIVTLLHI